MYRYLDYKSADCTDIFSVNPTNIITQTGKKNQVVHELDDGSLAVVGLSNNSFFDVVLQWKYLSSVDHATVLDFWHSATKGDGQARTFIWEHPFDGQAYTVRFRSELTSSYDHIEQISVSAVTLRVEGKSSLFWHTGLSDIWATPMADIWNTSLTAEV